MPGPDRFVGLRARDTVVVVVACSANVCRSPHLAFLLEREIGRSGLSTRVAILDGGVDTEFGQPSCRRLSRLLPGSGPAVRNHVSAPIDEELLRRADLVIAASRSERARLAELAPETRGRTFTAYEAIGTMAACPDEELVALEREAVRDRLTRLTTWMNRRRTSGDVWDIPDAHTSRARHTEVAQHLRVTSAGLALAIRALVEGPSG